jgi:hypothetical protein
MNNSRRSFLKDISLTAVLLAGGGIKFLSEAEAGTWRKKVIYRFAIASDGHYGQPGTASDDFYRTIVEKINGFHKEQPLNYCIINGDVIHNEKALLVKAKQHLDRLSMPYKTGKGNHDMVSNEYWKEVWGEWPDLIIKEKDCHIIIANTSNEKGEYLSPDLAWLKDQLELSKKKKNVFLVLHIPQIKWTANAIDTPAFPELLKQYTNVKAVFHGHEHDQDGVKMHNDIPYLFDSHFGGNWGTGYKGFRVVELMNDGSVLTYIMNPVEKINESTHQVRR